MKRLLSATDYWLQRIMLRVAALLVPSEQRREWLREWDAELWHVRRSCANEGIFSWQSEWEVLAFCLGAFADAYCLRGHADQEGTHTRHTAGSVRQSILGLSGILALCIISACLLPGVRAVIDTASYQTNPNIVLIESPVGLKQFQVWNSTQQRYFDELAFYRTVRQTVSLPAGHAGIWQVAYSSANLFTLLGLPIRQGAVVAHDGRSFPAALLSQKSWERDFGTNPQIVGQLARVGSRTVRIAGVVPYGAWRLPSNPDAWILEQEAQLSVEISGTAYGFMLGHLTRSGMDFVAGNSVTITSIRPNGDVIEFFGTMLNDRECGPWSVCGFSLLLVALALPAVSSVALGESQFSTYRPAWKQRIPRWIFLASKIVLVAAIGCTASLDLAYGLGVFESSTAQLLQFMVCFGICLFGMRWALMDQSHRCPVCLRCVSNPAQVGHASHTFLGWSGTEMMCIGGHTLLHVPNLPTSWFSSQRWLYLDTSWEFLFADS